MSTDLQLPEHVLPTRLASLKIKLPTSPTKSDTTTSCTIQENIQEHEKECQTPTSLEHKIPVILTCPPAPKRKRVSEYSPTCKRRILSGFEFYEYIGKDEIEAFFKETYEFIGQKSSENKRRFSDL
ncbi:cyclin-dependent protein kinase inhibitor SMR1-like protein [Tanacetum coccineum]